MAVKLGLLFCTIFLLNISFLNGNEKSNIIQGINFNSSPLSFLENLSELPLENLLKLKKSVNELKQTNFSVFQNDDVWDEDVESRIDNTVPTITLDKKLLKNIMALTDEKKIVR